MQSHLPAISPEIDSVEAHALFAPFLDDLRAQLLVAQAVRPRVKFKKSGRQWRAFRPLTRKGRRRSSSTTKNPCGFISRPARVAHFRFSDADDGLSGRIESGRLGSVEEIADAVVFLLTGAA
jgi:hypothetical protein